MAVLEYRADCHRELLAARSALVKPLAPGPLAARLRFEFVNGLVFAVALAMRAYRTVRPAQRLKQRPRLVIVGIVLRQRYERQFFRVKFLGFCSRIFIHALSVSLRLGFVTYINPKRLTNPSALGP